MRNGNGIPKTTRELYYFCKGEFEALHNAINDIKERPDSARKWIGTALTIGMFLIALATAGVSCYTSQHSSQTERRK